MVAFGECGFAAEIPAFAGMEDGRRRQLKEFPFPRKRESRGAASSATHRRQATLVSASRNFPLTREEIPAFAGMERGAGMEDGGRRQLKEFPFWRKPESHSRDSENFPRSGTLRWSPVGERGFAAEIPAFAGMEDGRRRQLKEFPFPRKRESPCLLIVCERDAKRQLEIRGDSRFRGNGSVFYPKEKN